VQGRVRIAHGIRLGPRVVAMPAPSCLHLGRRHRWDRDGTRAAGHHVPGKRIGVRQSVSLSRHGRTNSLSYEFLRVFLEQKQFPATHI
jgi:hypothetical protein